MFKFNQYRENMAFQTVEEMESHVQEHINTRRLEGATKKVLICIKQYSKLNKGICKLKAETIANKIGVSVRTVMRAIKKLVELEVIQKENGTKLNGIKGASTYIVLPCNVISGMSHRVISGEHCNINGSEGENENAGMSHRVISGNPCHINVCEGKNEAEYINSFNIFKTSTLNNIYLYALEHENFMNEYQKQLVELLNSFGLDKILGEELHKVVLATEINSVEDFHFAKGIIFNIARDLESGRLTPQTTIRAIYKGAYNKKIERMENQKVQAAQPVEEVAPTVTEQPEVTETLEQPVKNTRPVKFYNWLEERENSYTPLAAATQNTHVDFEAERAKILAKIGQSA